MFASSVPWITIGLLVLSNIFSDFSERGGGGLHFLNVACKFRPTGWGMVFLAAE